MDSWKKPVANSDKTVVLMGCKLFILKCTQASKHRYTLREMGGRYSFDITMTVTVHR